MDASKNCEKGMTRRQFVKGSAAGGAAGLAVGAGGIGLAMHPRAKPWLPEKWDYETDIVVAGSGFAGSNAAIAGHDSGARVIVLEKAPEKYEELADKTGIDGSELVKTVARYNRYCKNGKDGEFNRSKQLLFPVATPPFYSAELGLTCTNTQGGPKHNGGLKPLTGITGRSRGFIRRENSVPSSAFFTPEAAISPRP